MQNLCEWFIDFEQFGSVVIFSFINVDCIRQSVCSFGQFKDKWDRYMILEVFFYMWVIIDYIYINILEEIVRFNVIDL